MHNRYFNFESMVSIDENGVTKIEISTEDVSGMKIDATFTDYEEIIVLMKFISYLTLLKPGEYQRSLIAYKDWYSNEIIRRLTSDTTYFDKKSEAKKEVLAEAMQRRNKLIKQIEKAMSHYNETKNKIDDMEAIRSQYQKIYPGPLVVLLDNTLVFENLTEYQDIYYQIELMLPEKEEFQERQNGFGWLEFSKVFADDINGISLGEKQTVHLINSKPRSDPRILRRGDRNPSVLFRLGKMFQNELNNRNFALHHFYQNRKYNLSKAQIFAIVSKVIGHFTPKQIINFSIVTGPELNFAVLLKENGISISIHDDQLDELNYHISTTIFSALETVLPVIQHASIGRPTFNYGISILINTETAKIFLNSNNLISMKFLRIREVIRNYYLQNSNTIDNRIFDDNFSYTISKKFFPRSINLTKKTISYRERKAYLIIKNNEDSIQVEGNKIKYSDKEVEAIIQIPIPSNENDIRCNCQSFHKEYLCAHVLALIIFGYKGGYFYA